MMARNPRITPLHIVGFILLATFGLLLAGAGIRIDLPNLTLMGVAVLVLLTSGLASLVIDYFTPRLQVCPRISVTDGGVIVQRASRGPLSSCDRRIGALRQRYDPGVDRSNYEIFSGNTCHYRR